MGFRQAPCNAGQIEGRGRRTEHFDEPGVPSLPSGAAQVAGQLQPQIEWSTCAARPPLGERLMIDIEGEEGLVCQNGTLVGHLSYAASPPFPLRSPTVVPPCPLPTETMP